MEFLNDWKNAMILLKYGQAVRAGERKPLQVKEVPAEKRLKRKVQMPQQRMNPAKFRPLT